MSEREIADGTNYANAPADIRATAENIAANYSSDAAFLSGAIAAALHSERERCAKIAETDTDWTLFQRQSKRDPLSGAETNVFAGPEDDGTYPTAKNVFAYTTGIAAGRAIASSIRQGTAS